MSPDRGKAGKTIKKARDPERGKARGLRVTWDGRTKKTQEGWGPGGIKKG